VLAEQTTSARLLLSLAPDSMLEQLKHAPPAAPGREGDVITDGYAELTVLFADLVGLTKFSKGASARVLVGVLNDLSSRLEGQGGKPEEERSKTVGDAYLAAVGLPDAVTDHTIRSANKALDLAEAVKRFNAHSGYQLKVRVGFETDDRADKRKVLHALH
jgi:class 3 adenylate cyclase